MPDAIIDDLLLIGEVSEIRGTKVKVRIYGDANEAHTFYHGMLIRGVSVGSYLKIPCGYDSVIGVVEGDYQQPEPASKAGYDARTALGHDLSRYVDVSIFGVMSRGIFERGVSVLPLIRSKSYLLSPVELGKVSSTSAGDTGFQVGTLAGHDGVPVKLPISPLFASHIGVFGNTGSGKSNTLCKLYTDCLSEMTKRNLIGSIASKFVFIDFNGEYVGRHVLSDEKDIYRLDTRSGGDRIPVPDDFYFDADIWSILTRATEKTQRPFLSRCVYKAKAVTRSNDPSAYLMGMLRKLLGGYCGNALVFGEQRNELSKMLAQVIDLPDGGKAEEVVLAAFDSVEVFSDSTIRQKDRSVYLNSAEDAETVFAECLGLPIDFGILIRERWRLLRYISYLVFLEQWREGRIVREHIAPWLGRYAAQLEESANIYDTDGSSMLARLAKPVAVFSLLKVNQEQKKIIPLVIAKYLYQEQKARGQDDQRSSTHLIVDEAHNILSYSSQRENENWRDYRLETFEEIVKEGRKFGMYLTVCSQRPADISPTILSQMHNYFIHRLVNDDDLRSISRCVAFIDSSSMSMIPVLPQGCCIVSGTAASHPIRVQVERLDHEKQPMSYDRDLGSAWGIA